MKSNRLKIPGELGQSIWLDYIRRDLMVSGELHRLIANDGLRGMTSNPSILDCYRGIDRRLNAESVTTERVVS